MSPKFILIFLFFFLSTSLEARNINLSKKELETIGLSLKSIFNQPTNETFEISGKFTLDETDIDIEIDSRNVENGIFSGKTEVENLNQLFNY